MKKTSSLKVRFRSLSAAAIAILFLFQLPVHADFPGQPLNKQGITFPSQAQLGNIFAPGDKVQIQAAISNGSSVDWVVSDFQDRQVDSGTTAVTNGTVTIEPKTAELGIYILKITAKADGATKGEGTTSYAVIPRLDNSKMSDARFGVASHFGKFMTPDLAPVLAKAGVANVRDSMDWSWIETKPGVFDFTVHDFLGRMQELDKNHINNLYNIVFGNPLHYDNPSVQAYCAAPHTQSQYDAYSQLCVEHIKAFGPLLNSVEIWNEYNGSFAAGKAAEDRPKYYTEMLKSAYTAIKAERSDVQVIGGALNDIPLPYAEKLFQHGALDYMDGIVIHNYGGRPATIEGQIRQLVDLMKKYNNGVAKPIWVTEFGDWTDKTLVRNEEAGRLTKMYAMLMNQPEVARAYWYLARDYPNEGFPTMGLVHTDDSPMGKYTPTAVYTAYATMASQLFHARPKGHESVDVRTSVYHFERDGQGIWVCWADVDTANLVFQTQAPLSEVNPVGVATTLAPANGQVQLTLTDQPVYIIAAKASDVASVSETPRADKIVADASSGFSGVQGQDGWSYATYASNRDGSATYDPNALQPMTYTTLPGDWGYSWNGPGQWYNITAEQCQPTAANGNQMWAVRRWTSTADGDLHLRGEISRGDGGDGVGCRIFVDGQEVHSKLIRADSSDKIDQNITVKKGSQVDFAITPGPGTDTSFDATGFRMTILTVPK